MKKVVEKGGEQPWNSPSGSDGLLKREQSPKSGLFFGKKT